jgi:hypothetical protein
MAETCRDVISDALRKIGVVAMDEPMTADQAEHGRRAFERMLRGWQNKGWCVWAKDTQSQTLTTSEVYSLDGVRPLEILSCRFRQNGVERPMMPLTRDEYDSLPVKDVAGSPTTYYYDRQRTGVKLYIWPLLASPAGETLEITYTRELIAPDLNDEPDVPDEWLETAVYALAARLADDYEVQAQRVVLRAEELLSEALGFDREGSVWFNEPR